MHVFSFFSVFMINVEYLLKLNQWNKLQKQLIKWKLVAVRVWTCHDRPSTATCTSQAEQPLFLAHLAHRWAYSIPIRQTPEHGYTMAHRWAYSIPMLWRLSYVVIIHCPQCLNIFSETTWPIKAKFCVEPLWVVGTKVLFSASGLHDHDGCHAHIW